ncbi:MAG: hypothetical protein MAGBODY4_00812 [Candidatus Marinimicrobia bacterium]|nr:hypothetical protein [Candidatus Neomarinimicrobiota bacterium]
MSSGKTTVRLLVFGLPALILQTLLAQGPNKIPTLDFQPIEYFNNQCARCHGPGGSFYGEDFARDKSLQELLTVVEEIRQATGKSKTLVKEYQGIIEEYYDDLKVNEGDTTHEKTQQMEFVDEKQSKERNNGEK